MTNEQTRDDFEAAYAAINPIATTKETAWVCYQAATLAERERCALMCEKQSDDNMGHIELDQAAENIRNGLPPTATPPQGKI